MPRDHDRQLVLATLSGSGLSAPAAAFAAYLIERGSSLDEAVISVRRQITLAKNTMRKSGLFARKQVMRAARVRSKRRV
jgi:hypothetical protein